MSFGEDTALREECAIPSRVSSASSSEWQGCGTFCGFFRRQVVQVLVDRIAGMDLVLHAVEAGHHHRGEREVGIRRRIGEAHFDAARLRARHERNAAGRRAVLRRVRQVDRRFEAGHETLVGVGAGVGDRVQRLGVLDDAADVVQREFGQTGVAVAGEQILSTLPDRLVHVHAGTVVADDRLGHEGRGLAVGMGDVPDGILQDLQPVGALHEGVNLVPISFWPAVATSW